MSLEEEFGVDKKIVERIRKLLSMANSKVHESENDNEHERDTAMRRALKLMAKHNLTMHDLGEKVDQEQRVSEEVKFRAEPWAAQLVMVAADMFFCYVYMQRRSKKFVFVGKESNVATAKEMAAYLIDSVAKASRRATTKANGSSSFKTAFRKGATNRIYLRAKQIQREAEEESAVEVQNMPGTALVLASFYKQEEASNLALVKQMGVTITETVSRERPVTNSSGYKQGKAFGNTVSFNKQIT